MIQFADPYQSYLSYKDEINNAIKNVLKSGNYILGDEVVKFEKSFAKYCNSKYCVAVGSGTDALFLSLKSISIKEHDEVLTVSHTAVATISAITSVGAKPVYIDIDPETFNIEISKIESSITKKTKAIIVVHLYGNPAEIIEIKKIAEKYGLHVIEDCAQAHGAENKGEIVGSIGNLGCFSFYPSKNLSAIGDAGAIVTSSKKLYEKLLLLRQYGWDESRVSIIEGYNSRMDELQAAILNVKLKYLDDDTNERIDIANIYNNELSELPIELPKNDASNKHVYHQYVIQTNHRDEMKSFLEKNDIYPGVHYPIPSHLQRAWENDEIKDLAVTESICKKILSLPIYPGLSDKQILVANKIKEFFCGL